MIGLTWNFHKIFTYKERVFIYRHYINMAPEEGTKFCEVCAGPNKK